MTNASAGGGLVRNYVVLFSTLYIFFILLPYFLKNYISSDVPFGAVDNLMAVFASSTITMMVFAYKNRRVFSKAEYWCIVAGCSCVDAVLQVIGVIQIWRLDPDAFDLSVIVWSVGFVVLMHALVFVVMYSLLLKMVLQTLDKENL